MRGQQLQWTVLLSLGLLLAGCGEDPSGETSLSGATGGETDADPQGTSDGEPPAPADILPDVDALGAQGVRRLSRNEIRWAIIDLAGVDPEAHLDLLPTDERTPFDNDSTTQFPSEALVVGLDAFAQGVARDIMASPSAREYVVGCQPAGPGDEACLRTFVEQFGRRVFRRPLESDEVDEYVAFADESTKAGDFFVGATMVTRALLQDLEFVYRIERGVAVQGRDDLFELDEFEIAARLSFTLWGSIPDDELLDQAAAGQLSSRGGRRLEAERMLADPRSQQQLERLHAMWLDYDKIAAAPDLAGSLENETSALLRRVVFEERRPWLELLTFAETFVDRRLAQHYEMPDPGPDAAWVEYPANSGRGGLLSHGSFLSGITNFGDTSPVLRGKNVLERMLCQEIPPPPPEVNVAEPPDLGGPDACKEEIFSMRDQEACAACHVLVDNIGYGLEAFGPTGAFREHEDGRPDCQISGDGAVSGLGEFNGPR